MTTPKAAWRRFAATLASFAMTTALAAHAETPINQSSLEQTIGADQVLTSPIAQSAYSTAQTAPETGQPLPPCNACECGDACSCGDACGMTCAAACAPAWAHRSGVFADLLFLHASDADMHHAQQQNGVAVPGPGVVPFGHIGVADPDLDVGFRIGGALALSESTSFAASYMFYECDAVSSVVAPTVPAGGGAVGSLVHHPAAAITASAGPVDAAYDIDFQLADAEYRALIWGDERGWLNYSLGGRFGHLEQDFIQSGVFAGAAGGLIRTRTGIDFDGAGALFGVDGQRRIGSRRLAIYGNAGVSPVFGQFSTVYEMTNDTTATLLANSVWKDDRVVTILDYELGLAWTGPSGRVRISGGYLAQFWFNTVTTPEFIDAVQATNYTGVGDTLTFDGFVSRIEFLF